MNPIYDLLRSDGSIVINKNLIFGIGLNESIIYAELISRYNYFDGQGDITEDGYFFNTIDDLHSGTGLGEKPQRTAINNLEKLGLVEKKLRGIPPKRFFKIVDNEVLLKNLLLQGKNKQAEIHSSSKLRLLGGIKDSQIAETNTLYGRTNNTKGNNTKSTIQNNYNGTRSVDACTANIKTDGIEVDPHTKSARRVVSYYFSAYMDQFGEEHPKLKKKQLDKVTDAISSFMSEYSADDSNLKLMVDRYLEREMNTGYNIDYNINHFATEGIMVNLYFDVVK